MRLPRFGAALLAVVLAGTLAASEGTAQARRSYPYHPYSAPSWYPLRGTDALMDCAESNPGCQTGHKDESMTLGTQRVHKPVYAAGAGRLHWGAHATPDQCPASGPHTLGNWVWIDHGAGVMTRYAHLEYRRFPGDGVLVTPRTVIGFTSNTGITGPGCDGIAYLNFQIAHNRKDTGAAVPYPLGRLRACNGSTVITYPLDYPNWNDVPLKTLIPASPNDCVPSTAPNTPARPGNVALRPAGSKTLRLTWVKPASGPTVRYVSIEFQYYSTSLRRFGYVDPAHPYLVLNTSPSFPTSKVFTGLRTNTRYRARVWFNGGDGWSLEGYWKEAVAG